MLCSMRAEPSTSAPKAAPASPDYLYGHVMCSFCLKRNTVLSPTLPDAVQCVSCGRSFPLVRRFIHEFAGSTVEDTLELPCLRGVTEPARREALLKQYVSTVLSARRCSYSSLVRDVNKLMMSVVSRVERMLVKEEKHVQEECSLLMSTLLLRVEQYSRGELHCFCFQPFMPQRHFIQCDRCDVWYHTSCVGIDSRKLATITSFLCPWCRTSEEDAPQLVKSDEGPCSCPYCGRVFPRPCNLSRHLHAKHGMKWTTHVSIHMNVSDYLDTCPTSRPRSSQYSQLCTGCYAADGALEEYEMDKSHYRFLLRKLRTKPSQWWIGKEVKIWSEEEKDLCHGVIRCIRPRSDFCIRLRNGKMVTANNLFDPERRVRLIILNGFFELELYHALPISHVREAKRDLELFASSR